MRNFLLSSIQDVRWGIQKYHEVRLRHERRGEPRNPHRATIPVTAWIHEKIRVEAVEDQMPGFRART